jgi:16S rRNA G966 N2-methylase RsmD
MGSKRRWASALVDALAVAGETLVDLCSGTAAVSLAAMSRSDAPNRVVLVDAGPWGDVWSVLRAGGGPAVADVLDGWRGRDVADLWAELHVTPPSAEPAERVANYLWLQARAAGNIPCWWSEERGEWRSPTGAKTDPEADMSISRRTKGIAPSIAGVRGWGSGNRTAGLIARRVRALDRLPWDRVTVVHGDVRSVEPIPGAVVYHDPPYQGCPRYAALLPRAEVLALATRWADAGCRVAVSEAEPLPIDGWTVRKLARREWVTANWPIVLPEQLDLPGVAA